MADANAHWPRWIRASIAKYFEAQCITRSLPILVEGISETEAATIRAADHVELRIHGPATRQQTAGEFHLEVDVNLLFTSLMGEQLQNAYAIVAHAAALQLAAMQPIPIYKHGTGVDDDGTQLGCLALRSGRNDPVQLFDFGEIGKEERVRQLMVDAKYYIDL